MEPTERKRSKTGASKGRRGGGRGTPETRLFSGAKVARVLAKLGVEFHAFVAEYEEDTTRASRSAPLSEGERAAIERFLKHRQIAELARELGCSVASAHARVTKFVLETRPSG